MRTTTAFKITILAGLLITILSTGLAYAEEKGTASEAKALLSRAVSYYQTTGRDKAFATFNNPKGRFVHSDLYVYVIDADGKILAHGVDAKLIGENLFDREDAAGKKFIKAIIDDTKKHNKGAMDYKWTNPQTKKIEQKSTFFERVGDLIFICGYYK